MLTLLTRSRLAWALGAAGAAVLLVPVLLGFDLPSAGAISSNMIGVVMMLTAFGFAYGRLSFWSAFVLGAGAWTLALAGGARLLRRGRSVLDAHGRRLRVDARRPCRA